MASGGDAEVIIVCKLSCMTTRKWLESICKVEVIKNLVCEIKANQRGHQSPSGIWGQNLSFTKAVPWNKNTTLRKCIQDNFCLKKTHLILDVDCLLID